jgi:hypothetical protein
MKDLKDIQIQIKKELGGVSLNHLLNYLEKEIGFIVVLNCNSCLYINFDYCEKEFEQDFILLNDQNQALNIFGQSEEFQRELYDAIQIIKNINN